MTSNIAISFTDRCSNKRNRSDEYSNERLPFQSSFSGQVYHLRDVRRFMTHSNTFCTEPELYKKFK